MEAVEDASSRGARVHGKATEGCGLKSQGPEIRDPRKLIDGGKISSRGGWEKNSYLASPSTFAQEAEPTSKGLNGLRFVRTPSLPNRTRDRSVHYLAFLARVLGNCSRDLAGAALTTLLPPPNRTPRAMAIRCGYLTKGAASLLRLRPHEVPFSAQPHAQGRGARGQPMTRQSLRQGY